MILEELLLSAILLLSLSAAVAVLLGFFFTIIGFFFRIGFWVVLVLGLILVVVQLDSTTAF